MSLLVVGSIAFDSITTPVGKAEETLGGSAIHFSLAASLFTKVRLVGVVGTDFPMQNLEPLRKRGVDLQGVEVAKGATFRWKGLYEGDMNEAKTLETHLNVFGDFQPKLPAAYQDSRFVFLANGVPRTQLSVLNQVQGKPFVAADTMNLWIQSTRPELLHLLSKVDLLTINEGEARMLTDCRKIIQAGRAILDLGPKTVMIKAGEHGAFLFNKKFEFALPAYPTGDVQDPTGAGDSFAGGAMGYLTTCQSLTDAQYRLAMAYGTVASSFAVEKFGTQGLQETTRDMIEARFREFERFIRL